MLVCIRKKQSSVFVKRNQRRGRQIKQRQMPLPFQNEEKLFKKKKSEHWGNGEIDVPDLAALSPQGASF